MKFYIIAKVRDRLHDFFKYNNIKKVKTADEYGINYQKIANYLGECPGKRKDYHIDHVFPLAAFDFNNKLYIRTAFAPENHQWLKAEENLKKGVQYNQEDFENYIKGFQKK